MKVTNIVKVMVCFVVSIAVVAGEQSEGEKNYWKVKNFLQAYNEDMQNGIRRLNCNPQQVGVTPINGALLLSEADLSVPCRHGNFPVIRYYNSKIWLGDTINAQPHSTLFYDNDGMGVGWYMNFGRLEYDELSQIWFYVNAAGIRIAFQPYGSNFLATDGSFMLLKGDTVKVGDGTNLIFDCSSYVSFVEKIIDPNGNVTSFHYSDWDYLDSIKTSTNKKIVFYYNTHGTDQYTLDSIKYLGYGSNIQKIVYNYNYNVVIDSSPFSSYSGFSGGVCLLRSVVYPNGDSVYYNYNQYCELTGYHTTGNGLKKYEYATDSFQIPGSSVFPPQGTLGGKLQMTRGIVKVKEYDPWSAPDTNIIQYKRVRTWAGDLRAISNPDSVKVTDAEGNYQVSYYGCTRDVWYESDLQWVWDAHGRLDSTIFLR